MVAHTEAHQNDDFIKIGTVTRGAQKGAKRPEHHCFNNFTGKYFPGGDAILDEIRVPGTFKWENDKLYCRKCGVWSVKFSTDRGVISQTKGVEKMRRHEDRCDGKKKKGKKNE